MGNVRIKSDMSLTGDLNAPRVEGELGVTTGRIDLDPILAQTGTSAYATEQTEYGTNDQQGQTQAPSAFWNRSSRSFPTLASRKRCV